MTREESPKEEGSHALRFAGGVLLAVGTCLALTLGALDAFSPHPQSKLLAWVALLGSAAVMVFTVQWWLVVLRVLLLSGLINSLLELQIGHRLANPSAPISRGLALEMAVFFAISLTITQAFAGRRLERVDRVALLAFVACILWGAVRTTSLVPAMILGPAILVLALAYRRFQSHKGTPR